MVVHFPQCWPCHGLEHATQNSSVGALAFRVSSGVLASELLSNSFEYRMSVKQSEIVKVYLKPIYPVSFQKVNLAVEKG